MEVCCAVLPGGAEAWRYTAVFWRLKKKNESNVHVERRMGLTRDKPISNFGITSKVRKQNVMGSTMPTSHRRCASSKVCAPHPPHAFDTRRMYVPVPELW